MKDKGTWGCGLVIVAVIALFIWAMVQAMTPVEIVVNGKVASSYGLLNKDARYLPRPDMARQRQAPGR